jgi:hypothetical protein
MKREDQTRRAPEINSAKIASITVHLPIETLVAFQRTAQSQRRSESDLAKEAFEAVSRKR